MKLNHLVFHTASIAPDWPGSGFPPVNYHRVVSLCGVHLVGTDASVFTATLDKKDIKERDVVNAFFSEVGEGQSLVTFYGSSYTIPLLTQRAVYHAVPAKSYYQQREFYDDPVKGHIDISYWLSNFGSSGTLNFDALLRTCALPPRKKGDVAELFRTGKIGVIRDELQLDVLLMTMAFLRIYYVTGDINLKTFQGMGKKVLESFRSVNLCSAYLDNMAVAKYFLAAKK